MVHLPLGTTCKAGLPQENFTPGKSQQGVKKKQTLFSWHLLQNQQQPPSFLRILLIAFLFCRGVPHPSLLLRKGRARESWWQLAAHCILDTLPPFLPRMIHLDAVCKVKKEADSSADRF